MENKYFKTIWEKNKVLEALNALVDMSLWKHKPEEEHSQTVALCDLVNQAEQGIFVSIDDIQKALNKTN